MLGWEILRLVSQMASNGFLGAFGFGLQKSQAVVLTQG